ncbi:hypothetical protein ACFLU6_14090 [Acidobacteriota bacterium]
MKHQPVKDRCCQNSDCPLYGKFGNGNIIRHSFYTTRQGRRRRFCCRICKRTFSSTAGTPYYRLHKSRSSFDELVQMTVEGVGISAIARIKGYAWNTVARWRRLAALFANRFNEKRLKGFELKELQGDEIKTFVITKKKPVWIFTMLEIWSRLWISCVIGRRSYRNVKQVIGIAIQRGEYKESFLFTTDGFEPYAWAAKAMLSVICIYAQVMKKRRKDRVVHVNQNLIVGTRDQLEEALFNSEDSSTINTSFVERHNLTIRQGSSYLCRKPLAIRGSKNVWAKICLC